MIWNHFGIMTVDENSTVQKPFHYNFCLFDKFSSAFFSVFPPLLKRQLSFEYIVGVVRSARGEINRANVNRRLLRLQKIILLKTIKVILQLSLHQKYLSKLFMVFSTFGQKFQGEKEWTASWLGVSQLGFKNLQSIGICHMSF